MRTSLREGGRGSVITLSCGFYSTVTVKRTVCVCVCQENTCDSAPGGLKTVWLCGVRQPAKCPAGCCVLVLSCVLGTICLRFLSYEELLKTFSQYTCRVRVPLDSTWTVKVDLQQCGNGAWTRRRSPTRESHERRRMEER